MEYLLQGGPLDGAEMEPDEVWHIGEMWVPAYGRRDPAYAPQSFQEGVWMARYKLRSDGLGEFVGWEKVDH